MLIFAAIPVIVPKIRRFYRPLFLFGTGALLSLCLFHLIPDMFQIGGVSGLSLAFAAWLIYSLIHLYHSHHHVHVEPQQHEEACNDSSHDHSVNHHSPYPFYVAITIHCFSSGLFLGVSDHFSPQISHAIFLALIAHKAYEAMAVSSLLVSFRRPLFWTLGLVTIYVASFPIGYVLAQALDNQMSHLIILSISGVAVGSLLGCLILDFIVPSYHLLKLARSQVVWLVLGALLTLVF